MVTPPETNPEGESLLLGRGPRPTGGRQPCRTRQKNQREEVEEALLRRWGSLVHCRWQAAHPVQLMRLETFRRGTPHRSSSLRRKCRTSAWRLSMCSTRKTLEHIIPAHSLLPNREAANREAAEAREAANRAAVNRAAVNRVAAEAVEAKAVEATEAVGAAEVVAAAAAAAEAAEAAV
jgi:hypothetical protein